MKRKFVYQYEPDLKGTRPAHGDAMGPRIGFVLYERDEGNSSTLRCIDSPELFRDAVSGAVASAARSIVHEIYQSNRNEGIAQINSDAVSELAGAMQRVVYSRDFSRQAAYRYSQCFGGGAVTDGSRTPWRREGGGVADAILQHYGSELNTQAVQSTPNTMTRPAGQPPGDATGLVLSLCGEQLKMSGHLLQKAAQMKGSGFNAPAFMPGHACSHLPMETADLWTRNMKPEAWIQQYLHGPALHYADAKRTNPPLRDLMTKMARDLRLGPQQASYFTSRMMANCSVVRSGVLEYSLRSIHDVLSEMCGAGDNGEKMRGWMRSRLKQYAPPPADMTRFLMDSNYQDERGNPIFMAFSYDPFEGRMNAVWRNRDGTHQEPIPPHLYGSWKLATPFTDLP